MVKPVSAKKKADQQAEREALAAYEAQLVQMCWRKMGYLTERDAQRKITRLAKYRPGVQLSVYKCPACIFWHLTKQSQNGRNREGAMPGSATVR